MEHYAPPVRAWSFLCTKEALAILHSPSEGQELFWTLRKKNSDVEKNLLYSFTLRINGLDVTYISYKVLPIGKYTIPLKCAIASHSSEA